MEDIVVKRYVEHRKRLKSRKTEIDNKPPLLHISNYLHIQRDKSDANTYNDIIQRNMNVLQKINTVMRTHGVLRTFRTRRIGPIMGASMVKENKYTEYEKKNRQIAHAIKNVKPEVDSWQSNFKKINMKKKTEPRKIPPPIPVNPEILKKYSHVEMPPKHLWNRFFRPVVYVDLSLRDYRNLGRLVFQLVTEAAPQVVSELVHNALCESKKCFKIVRVFPQLWMESELKMCETSVCREPLEYDMRAVDHSMGPGIMSFSKMFLKGFDTGFLNFSVSFKPLPVLNGHRVAFGYVVAGKKVLNCLQEWGTKNGKLIQEIRITSCGLL